MNMDINVPHVPDDLRARYLARRSKDVEDCFLRFRAMDWSYFERLGHQLKGNASSYGYEELGHIALRIEQSAQAKDVADLEKNLSEFKNWLEQQDPSA